MSLSVVSANTVRTVGEGPHWDYESQSLLYVDIWSGDVYKWDSVHDVTSKIHLDSSVNFVVPSLAGGYIVGQGQTFYCLNFDSGLVTNLANVDIDTKNRFNDAKCDFSGRLWAGTMQQDNTTPPEQKIGGLYSLEKNLTCNRHFSKIYGSNGFAWSADTSIMYTTDATARVTYAFDFDINMGNIDNQRIAIQFSEDAEEKLGFPGGMCIDATGKLWIACFGVGAVTRCDPNTGQVLQTVKLPTRWPTSCCFGGPDFDDLYVTTSKSPLTHRNDYNLDTPLGGSVFKISQLGTKGMPAPRFGG